MSLKAILVSVADWTLSKFGKTVLKGLGLGMFSSAVVMTLFQQLIGYAQNEWGRMSADVLQILSLANIDYGLSIIVGACILKITLMINKISSTEMIDGARDFRLMTRQVVASILELKEYNRFSKGIFGWVGFRTKWLQYDNIERSAGKTKWSMWKLFKYSVEGITGFSVAPLSLASVVGVLFCMLSFIMIAVIVVRTLVWGDPVSGWPSLACIIFLVSGVQLLCTGIVGEYLSKTYLETKKRPIFILKDSSDDKEQKHERT